MNFKKAMLTAVVTLSTASVYYAQQVKDSTRSSQDIETVVLTSGVADIAKERKTPVAVSTIKEAQIVEKLGNQEFPEILNTTPSVYATKSGGGFGDSKVNIRGFSQENIAVMINGVPVNDMENGAVYWSNWAGLSDVTSAMQVQRGLGASKLAIASVGGTINVLTRAADKKRGALVSVGVGNDDYHKALFAYNSGKGEKGWSTSFLMSRTAGSMYADGTQFEGANYYWALGYQKPGSGHDFQFTITGASQWHNQRTTAITIQNYLDMGDGLLDKKYADEPNRRYNADWGWRNGEVLSNRVNYYHKPVMSLNWDWKMSSASKLNSVFYASFGRGGGTGDLGRVGGKFASGYTTAEGQIDYNAIFAANALVNPNTAAASSTLVRRASINSHNWLGAIISFNHKINDNLNFTIGTDDRYYYGFHYQVISDLYGAKGYKDATNRNFYTAPNNVYTITPRVISNTFAPTPTWNPFGGKLNDDADKVAYANDGEVLWYGGFGQLEYTNDRISAFVSGAVSNQAFNRIDNFILDGRTLLNGQTAGFATSATNQALIQATAANPALNTETGFKNLLGYNVKAGINFNINANHNVFANVGYYSKQPFLNAVYPNNKNFLNPNLTNEKILGFELGYGFKSGSFNANLNLYRTGWSDRFLRRSLTVNGVSAYSNIEGITEIHQGAELDLNFKPINWLTLNGMVSYGDWFYQGNAIGSLFDESNQPISVTGTSGLTTLYLDKVKVGGSAQFTTAIGATVEPVKNLKFDASYRYADNLYANLNLLSFINKAAGEMGALKLPSFGLLDLGASFKIPLNNPSQFFTLRGNVYNVLDTTYIAESSTNIMSDLTLQQYADVNGVSATLPATVTNYNTYKAAGNYKGLSQQNQVFFGFGRTWAATLSFNF